MSNLNSIRNAPPIFTRTLGMVQPNEPLMLHQGPFEIRNPGINLNLNGKIRFQWLPMPRVEVSASGYSASLEVFEKAVDNPFEVTINGISVGMARIVQMQIADSNSLTAWMTDEVVLGDRSVPVGSVEFSVLNLKDLPGMDYVSYEGRFYRSRTRFEVDDFSIVLDKAPSYGDKFEALKASGGYHILYDAQLTKKSQRPILYSEAKEVLSAFSSFLSFVSGRRCPTCFMQGTSNGSTFWTDYTPYLADSFKAVQWWPPRGDSASIVSIWPSFYKMWCNEKEGPMLTTAIHWYVESNGNAGLVDGSIVMAQTCLELLYNWIVVEKNKTMQGKDASTIVAANKLRLLLSFLKVDFGFTDTCTDLRNVCNGDAPEALTQVRNAIVHAEEHKRERSKAITNKAKAQALHLALWYIELSLLKLLNYEGNYYCRTMTRGNFLKTPVPWLAAR